MFRLAERCKPTISLITILFFAIFAGGSCMYVNKRALTGEESDAPARAECSPNTPCEWHVYTPFSRELRYTIQNTCECAASTRCIKVDDDVSSTAYVFKCRSILSLVT